MGNRNFQPAWAVVLLCSLFIACSESEQQTSVGSNRMPSAHYHESAVLFADLPYRERMYVPVYSDIYIMNGEKKLLLTVTLSIRNTSLSDTLYVGRVDYYDSSGGKIVSYVAKPIELHPLESVEFLVEYRDEQGGPGANFIVDWGIQSASRPHPILQAVMIGAAFSQGISFVTEGKMIEKWEKADSLQ